MMSNSAETSNPTQEPCTAKPAAKAPPKPNAPKTPASGPTKAASKIEKVLSLLKRSRGATLDDLVQATGWLPHTTRAALTSLKKKGHTIERTKTDGVSRYTLAVKAAQ